MKEIFSGRLAKMLNEHTSPVSYFLKKDQSTVQLNQLIGHRIKFVSNGEIRCCYCQRPTKKSFNQGFCYPCFQKLARCDRCIMSPELCHFKAGTCREPEWAESHCLQPHIVYLANSSGLKVGITRQTQIPTRWIDQGAIQALPIIAVSSRHLSGLVEVILKEWVADKTNWRKMLKHDVEDMDLSAERDRLLVLAQDQIQALREDYPGEDIICLDDGELFEFEYPSRQWPEKIKTYNLDKTVVFEDTLMAIKGQYLIFESGCLNVRKYTSYDVTIFSDLA